MNKKIIIILSTLCVLLLGAVITLLVLKEKPKEEPKPIPEPTPSVEKVTIHFDSNGGSIIEDVTFDAGTPYSLPVPVKDGYIFLYWEDNGEDVSEALFDTAGEITLKAKWKKETEEENKEVEKVTIKFDSQGGEKVDSYVVDKGSQVLLPTISREGYIFMGWYLNGKKVLSTQIWNKNVTVVAKWEKKEEVKTYKVTFDSNGGSNVGAITVECEKTLTLPANPTRSGYTFVSWVDKNGKAILTGANLVCEDVTLTANWEKNKEYTCPDGYELKDTNKCVSMKTPEYYCETGKESNGTGSKVCYSLVGNPISTTCKDKNGYKGTYIPNEHGDAKCCYQELTSYIGQQENCTNNGGMLASNNHCYKQIELATESILNHTCSGTSVYRTSAELGNAASSGCYNLSQRTYGCKHAGEGYYMNYSYGKCVKTIDATLE